MDFTAFQNDSFQSDAFQMYSADQEELTYQPVAVLYQPAGLVALKKEAAIFVVSEGPCHG